MSVLFLSNSKRRREAEVNEMECRTKAGSRTTRTESETAQQLYNSALFIYFLFNWSFSGYKINCTIVLRDCQGMFASENQF